jgi:hypothetical protein
MDHILSVPPCATAQNATLRTELEYIQGPLTRCWRRRRGDDILQRYDRNLHRVYFTPTRNLNINRRITISPDIYRVHAHTWADDFWCQVWLTWPKGGVTGNPELGL